MNNISAILNILFNNTYKTQILDQKTLKLNKTPSRKVPVTFFGKNRYNYLSRRSQRHSGKGAL